MATRAEIEHDMRLTLTLLERDPQLRVVSRERLGEHLGDELMVGRVAGYVDLDPAAFTAAHAERVVDLFGLDVERLDDVDNSGLVGAAQDAVQPLSHGLGGGRIRRLAGHVEMLEHTVDNIANRDRLNEEGIELRRQGLQSLPLQGITRQVDQKAGLASSVLSSRDQAGQGALAERLSRSQREFRPGVA